MWREFFSLSKGEQRGFFVLISLFSLLFVTIILLRTCVSDSGRITIIPLTQKSRQVPEAKLMVDTLYVNSDGVSALSRFGLSDRVIINIMKYREAGGYYKGYDDLKKTYGFDTSAVYGRTGLIRYDFNPKQYSDSHRSIFSKKPPTISLSFATPAQMQELNIPMPLIDSILSFRERYYLRGSINADSLRSLRMDEFLTFLNGKVAATKTKEKQKTQQIIPVVDINKADTALLVKLSGIGIVLAQRIVEYREKLGGFVSLHQLSEVAGVTTQWVEANKDYLIVDATLVRKVPINMQGVEKLRKHPYISFYLAKEIVERRRIRGKFTSLDQTKGLPSFEKSNPFLIDYLTLEKR